MARLVKLTAYLTNVVSGYAVDLIFRVDEVAAIPAVPAVMGSDGGSPVIIKPATPAVPARARVTFKDGVSREFVELRDAIITAANA